MKQNRRSQSRILPLFSALLLIVSLAVLALGYLKGSVGHSLNHARQLEEAERFEEAFEEYQELADFLRGSRLLYSRFQDQYSEAMVGQMELLYRRQRYDEVIALADSSIQEEVTDLAAVYFWSGNAFFLKGVNQDVGEDSYSWFNRAEVNYRKALEHDQRERWGIRFNFELVRTLLAEAENNRGKEPIKIMRPTEALTEQLVKKVEG